MNNKHLALFDFDGTITNKDSLFDFLRHSFGVMTLVSKLAKVSPYLAANRIGCYPAQRAKECLLKEFVCDMSELSFSRMATSYSLKRLPQIIRPSALEKIRWHQSQSHEVVVVSASIESWLKPWCESVGVFLISSQLEVNHGYLSGNISGNNCNGREKVAQIKLRYDLAEYDSVYAYGDSKGDKDMLALADKAFYRTF